VTEVVELFMDVAWQYVAECAQSPIGCTIKLAQQFDHAAVDLGTTRTCVNAHRHLYASPACGEKGLSKLRITKVVCNPMYLSTGRHVFNASE
jgi:hypothetical protein